MLRLCRVLLAVAAISAVTAPSAAAVPDKHSALLGTMWTTILETPKADNPFFDPTGDNPCIDLGGGIVAPFAGGARFGCTVDYKTRIFVAGYSAECSTVEPPTVGGNEADLRACADAAVNSAGTVEVTLDGRPVHLRRVQTALLHFVLPEDNIFDLDPGTTGQSVGDGWVALLPPLRPGEHTIEITQNGILVNTTTITVLPKG
jgi:hypothetical protein